MIMRKYICILLLCFITLGCDNKNYMIEGNYAIEVLDFNDEIKQAVYDVDRANIGQNEVTLYLFYSSSCSHCHDEMTWLDSIVSNYEFLHIEKYEASQNNSLYDKVLSQMGINERYVPLTIIGDYYYIGFSESKKADFIKKIEDYSKYKSCDMVQTIVNGGDLEKCKKINEKE